MKISNFNITQFVATTTGCLAIIGAFGWLTSPRVDEKIKLEAKEYVQSLDYKDSLQKAINIEIRNYIDGATFQVKLQNYLESNQSDNVNVLAMFANEMGIPESQVLRTLSDWVKKDRPRFLNLLRIVREKHPETNPWTIVDE